MSTSPFLRYAAVLIGLGGLLAGSALADEGGHPSAPILTQPTPLPLPPVEIPKKTLIEGGSGLKQLHPEAKDVVLSYGDGETLLQLPKGRSGTIEIKPSQGDFDAEGFTRLLFDLKNEGASEVKYVIRLENADAEEWTKSATFSGRIAAGQAKAGTVLFPRRNDVKERYPELKVFFGAKPTTMKNVPGGLIFDQDHSIDPAHIKLIRITLFPSADAIKLSLGRVYASHPPVDPLFAKYRDRFFPFVDSYGQYLHAAWPGKVTSDADLKAATAAEEKDLAEHEGPADRSRYGGWTKGPRQDATGFFRTAKVDGRWWLVDPEGCLFWSDGVCCAGSGGAYSRTAGRERFFSGLPEAGTPLAQFYGKDNNGFSFTNANLYRKFGPDWGKINAELVNRRLKSWGMNTMGNWSSAAATSLHETPYFANIDPKDRAMAAKKRFPDVFSPTFVSTLRTAIESRRDSFDDPWCVGYFVDNELKFADGVSFVSALAQDPKETPCKIEWIADLKAKYGSIAEVNRLTGSAFADWDVLLANTGDFKADGIKDEADAFAKRIYDLYFKTCRDEVKRAAPHHLYCGSRFLWNVAPDMVALASPYCDVVSFNIYEYNVTDRKVFGADKPFLVGEFHFGALDRGVFGTGNRWAGDQQDRGGMCEDYMTSALRNPACVGAHWFQYNAQSLTGRDDGENFQIGLVDIASNPYPELRDALRRFGYGMYEARVAGANP